MAAGAQKRKCDAEMAGILNGRTSVALIILRNDQASLTIDVEEGKGESRTPTPDQRPDKD